MTNKEAIEIIKNEVKCVQRADTCGRTCDICELVMESEDILLAYQMAINALNLNE